MSETSSGTNGQTCSKCHQRPKAKSHDWCNECKAENQQRYQFDRDNMLERRGFVAGVKAMRDVLANEFERLGTGSFSGSECGDLIRRAPGPQV